jgi:hypothetical protein
MAFCARLHITLDLGYSDIEPIRIVLPRDQKFNFEAGI